MYAKRIRRTPVVRAALLGLAIGASAFLFGPAPAPAEARGGGAAPPPNRGAPAADPNQVMGAQLFDQCIRWVARNSPVSRTQDFYIHVTAELDLDTTRHRGPMRIWWKAPDKYRQELTSASRMTTKILNGNQAWIVHPNGRVDRMHTRPDAAAQLAQLKDDRARMGDLAQFITLSSLKGRGVVFTFGGEKEGSGAFAGKWLKITRTAPGVNRMHFWLAYTRDPQGRYVATYPGIIRVDGDPRQRLPTEDFVLRGWVDSPASQPRAFRYPRTIEAYSREPGRPAVRFLRATVNDIKINVQIPDARFRPR